MYFSWSPYREASSITLCEAMGCHCVATPDFETKTMEIRRRKTQDTPSDHIERRERQVAEVQVHSGLLRLCLPCTLRRAPNVHISEVGQQTSRPTDLGSMSDTESHSCQLGSLPSRTSAPGRLPSPWR